MHHGKKETRIKRWEGRDIKCLKEGHEMLEMRENEMKMMGARARDGNNRTKGHQMLEMRGNKMMMMEQEMEN